MVAVKLWLVVGGGDELMPGHGWSWVVAAKLWLVLGGRGWSHDLVIPINHVLPQKISVVDLNSEVRENESITLNVSEPIRLVAGKKS